MEVPLGIIPGGGACVNLRRLLGSGRALEAGHSWLHEDRLEL